MYFPAADASKPLISEYARFLAHFGQELKGRSLVLPSGKFFPDAFSPDQRGGGRMLARMQAHTQLQDIPIRLEVAGEATAGSPQSCNSGGCSSAPQAEAQSWLRDDTDAWTIGLDPSVLRHPVLLATVLSQHLGRIFIEETRREPWDATATTAAQSELAACALGLGVLLLEGAYVYHKSCGGPQVQQFTTAPAGALALWTALFAMHHNTKLSGARRCVGTTQAALLANAQSFANANRDLGRQLDANPLAVAQGHFTVHAEPPSLWARLRGTATPDEIPEPVPPLLRPAPPSSARKAPPDDGLAELVAEALSR